MRECDDDGRAAAAAPTTTAWEREENDTDIKRSTAKPRSLARLHVREKGWERGFLRFLAGKSRWEALLLLLVDDDVKKLMSIPPKWPLLWKLFLDSMETLFKNVFDYMHGCPRTWWLLLLEWMDSATMHTLSAWTRTTYIRPLPPVDGQPFWISANIIFVIISYSSSFASRSHGWIWVVN